MIRMIRTLSTEDMVGVPVPQPQLPKKHWNRNWRLSHELPPLIHMAPGGRGKPKKEVRVHRMRLVFVSRGKVWS